MSGCIVYEHENLVNGKRYFGITIKEPTNRWGKDGSGYKRNSHFWNAIQKYGWNEGFSHKILFEGLSVDEACEIEEMLIADYKTQDPEHGYNHKSGGEHGRHSEETRRKLSEAKKGENNPQYGKPLNEEQRRKIGEASKGRRHSEESRRKMSENNASRRPEVRQKISEALKGRTVGEETRRKLSEANKGKKASRKTRQKLSEVHKGRTHSEETRRKMSKAQKKRFENNPDAMKGENNPMYGKHFSEESRLKIRNNQPTRRPVEAIDPETETRVCYFKSMMDAQRSGFSQQCISRCCNGKQKTHKGLIWRYVENGSNE